MKENCTPISSNCITWTGPNIPCIKLCKGDSVTDVLYNFAMSYCDLLSQLDPSKYNLACLNDRKCPPKSFQELVQLLITKVCEIEKQEGPAGPAGENGNDGANGDTIELVTLDVGDVQCPCGGTLIQIFADGEVVPKEQYYLCSGCDGNDGEAGDPGPIGPVGPVGPKGDPGPEGVFPDTGWVDLLGFEWYDPAVAKPQVRRIGNTIHFRGNAWIPLSSDAGTTLIPFDPIKLVTTYYDQPYVQPWIATGGVTINGAGSVTFNNSLNVIPDTVLPLGTNLDNAYRKSWGTIATRPVVFNDDIDPQPEHGTSLTSAVQVLITADKKLAIITLKDLEETSVIPPFYSSPLRYLTSFVRNGDYVPDVRHPESNIHSLLSGPDTSNDVILRSGDSQWFFDCDAAEPDQIGGFVVSLDGLVAYVAP